ncbi:MAG TPA: 50S ribosomal protein L24 [Candidatus Atribacteria bacterium]|nr:50S ribosomal protein L24 [Candidatus Atribacteria bacterium]HPZ81090.1 50S ribosomal protein L24 [Candidatus Atribacteria bacterium]HQE24732.1 50S ribosomal protein L24 [Candidatus Atribacteria bacterium]
MRKVIKVENQKKKVNVVIKKGDLVEVVRGNDRGKRGKVLKVFPREGQAVVEGVNMVKKHARPTQDNPQGGIMDKEGPVRISNLRLICSRCNQPTKIRRTAIPESRSRVRVCKKCGEIIDKV